MTDISGFDQAETRFLYETLERYKLKIKLWPSHNLDDPVEVQYFTKVLYGDTRLLLDAFVEGTMLTKSATLKYWSRICLIMNTTHYLIDDLEEKETNQ